MTTNRIFGLRRDFFPAATKPFVYDIETLREVPDDVVRDLMPGRDPSEAAQLFPQHIPQRGRRFPFFLFHCPHLTSAC